MKAASFGIEMATALLLCVGVLLPAAVPAASEPQPGWDQWFSMRPESQKAWTVVPDPGEGYRFRVVRKDAPAQETIHKTLVLFPKKSSAYNTAMSKLLDIFLEKNLPVEFTIVNFRNDPQAGLAALSYAKENKFDLIYSMGSSSTAFVHKNFRGESIPVVSVCSKDPVLLGQMADYEKGSATNIAYTSLNVPLRVQMTYLLELKPNLKTIALMYARKNKSAVVTQVEPLRELAEEKGIRTIDVVVEDQRNARLELESKVPEAVESIRAVDPKGVDSVFWITGSTSVFREIATINERSWKIPVLSVVPDVVAEGDDSAVLSIGVSFESNAHLAAVYGANILSGEPQAGDMPVGIVSPPDIAINFRVARRIGMKVPFSFFESATFVYGYDGGAVRENGQGVAAR